MTIITVISQQPLTTEQVNSFRSVPQGINLTASGDGTQYLSNDGTYKLVSGASGTNLSIANKTSTTFDVLSSTGTDVTLPAASITEAGLLIATDKVKLNNLATVATSGSYADLTGTPTIPAAQVNSDWSSVSGVSQILNKPTLGTASPLNVPASGNAASGEVVKGDDTRLSDARTPLSHTHVIADVTGLQTALDGKFDEPVGDTTQYIAGDGSLVAFPVAGQAGTLVRQVRNQTGTTLTKGTVIYLSGASGNKPLALRAIANSEVSSDRTFGIVQADITNNSNGYVVVSGDLIGLDTSTLTEGSIVYLSGTVAGATTTTQPVSPLHSVVLGIVTRSHAIQGQIDVSIQNGFEVEDLHNVLITSKVNKDVLRYESSTGLWKNVQLATTDISDFNAATDARVVAGITGKENTITTGTTAQYWRGDKSWQTLDRAAVGLGNVDNTSDANKPVSTAQQTALNLKYDATNPNGYTTNTGTVTTASIVTANGFSGSVATASTTPAITLTLQNATTGQSGQLTSTDWNTFNGKQAALNGTGFVKVTGTTVSYDNSTYLTGNQTITVTGDVSGSGTTAITLNLGGNVVTNAKLAQVATATFKGRITASTGNVEDLTATQATSLLNLATTSLKGLIPATGAPSGKFLKDDLTWDTLAGGGGGLTLTEFEVDFGTKPIRSKKFTITAAGVTGSSKVIVNPSGNVATGRVGDDWEWDAISTSAKAGTGQFVLTCFASGRVAGKRKFYYTYS